MIKFVLKVLYPEKKLQQRLEGEIKSLAKLIGASVAADGRIKVNNVEYKGLPYNSLPAQMQDARACRKDIATMLLEERKRANYTNYHKDELSTLKSIYNQADFSVDISLHDMNTFIKSPSTNDGFFREFVQAIGLSYQNSLKLHKKVYFFLSQEM